MEKGNKNTESKEKNTKTGCLFVITGASGAGKDTVMDMLLKNPAIKSLNLRKVVTCTDRCPRPGEIHGIHYHFVTNEKLRQMSNNGELVEEITPTGLSNKATPKSEIERLLKGEDLVWRIDPSRAAEVASGEFWTKNFPENAELLRKSTIVICVTAPKEIIEGRRRSRDGEKFNSADYSKRDEEEMPHLRILREKSVLIDNLDGRLEETINTAVILTITHYEKVKNRNS
jgi:guanylate kinase